MSLDKTQLAPNQGFTSYLLSDAAHKGRTPSYYRVLKLWLEGLSYAEIGTRLGFSRQCAQQFLRPPRSMRLQVMAEAWWACEQCERIISRTGHIHHKSRTYPPNVRENLQYLCASCHALADSYQRRSAR